MKQYFTGVFDWLTKCLVAIGEAGQHKGIDGEYNADRFIEDNKSE